MNNMKIDIDKNCIDFMIVLVMVCITLQSTILSLIISNVFFSGYRSVCWISWINFIRKNCRHKFQQTVVISCYLGKFKISNYNIADIYATHHDHVQ